MHAAVVWTRVVPGANPNSRYLLPSLRFFLWFFQVALRKHLVISSLAAADFFVSFYCLVFSADSTFRHKVSLTARLHR